TQLAQLCSMRGCQEGQFAFLHIQQACAFDALGIVIEIMHGAPQLHSLILTVPRSGNGTTDRALLIAPSTRSSFCLTAVATRASSCSRSACGNAFNTCALSPGRASSRASRDLSVMEQDPVMKRGPDYQHWLSVRQCDCARTS